MATAVFCGLTTLDITQRVERVPRENEKIVSLGTAVDVGGPAANAARVAAAFGVSCQLITLLGNSVLAKIARNILENSGIELIDLAADSDFPLSTVLVDEAGGRSVISQNNPGRAYQKFSLDLGSDVKVLEVDGHLLDVQIQLARAAQIKNIPVVFDGGSWKAGSSALLPLLSHVIISADFQIPDCADTFAELKRHQYPLLAQSFGHQPVRGNCAGAAADFTVPVPQVMPQDTLGAGDVLHGAFTALLAKNIDAKTSLTQAVAAASQSTEFLGLLPYLESIVQ
ncbi:PfkB family carbohydrate kinase [uncultured Arcanobacterium sp.]|uniref:PfkB family carbohydrate kinase n=1 Tax=uncultured Arcanobacterium sp. TaxID=487520 RepID=UPI0026191080|nr:PfkB family carbohydrate kinase [uncultured Arcanobacterium sp.]